MIPNDCQKCDLYKTRTNIVNGFGAKSPDYLFVGEAPGEEEDKQGEPFVGPAGDVQRWLIDKAGIRNVRLENILHCRPVESYYNYGIHSYKNRKPTVEEINACKQYLIDEIHRVKPKVIIPLGKTATSFFIRKEENRFTMNDVLLKQYDWNGYPVLPAWHPSWILRGNISSVEDVIDVIKYGESIVKGKVKKAQLLTITTNKQFLLMIDCINKSKIFASDIESSKSKRTIGISFSWKEDTGVYLPLQTYDGFKLNDFWKNNKFIIKVVADTIRNNYAKSVWHNAKYDTRMNLEEWRVPIEECHDTGLMWGALNDTKMDGTKRRWGLEFLTRKFFPWWKDYKKEVTKRFKHEEDVDYSLLPLNVIGPYGAMDSLVTLKLFFLFYKMLYGKEFE